MSVATRSDCLLLDESDPLGHLRQSFTLPDGVIYLDGNSMGAMPTNTPERVQALTHQWAQHLVAGWSLDHWMDAPVRVGAKLAPLLGAAPHEVLMADSTSVILFKLLSVGLALRPERHVILTEHGNFPTDLYVAQGLGALLNGTAEVRMVDTAELEAAITDEVAVLLLTEVDYRTGRRHDMRRMTQRAHAAGALVLWDLCHSAGAVALELDACQADMAVGCGYKYLNGGPGAPAFLYLAQQHHAAARNPISGWLGHATPFTFEERYQPAAGITRMLSGSPSVLSLSALESSLDVFATTDMGALAAKSQALCDLFIELVDAHLGDSQLSLVTPRSAALRGSQVAWRHPQGYGIVQALIRRGVVGDFRVPDICRFGVAPLYLRYVDIWDAVEQLGQVLRTGEHLSTEFLMRATIT